MLLLERASASSKCYPCFLLTTQNVQEKRSVLSRDTLICRRRGNDRALLPRCANVNLGETKNGDETVREEEQRGVFEVVELFSGIGGMRLALERANVFNKSEVHFTAIDNNCNANAVYKANFMNLSSETRVLEGNIESFDVERLLASSVDGCEILTLSPPCQPYTRKGKNRGEKDARSTALARIIDIFEDAGEEKEESVGTRTTALPKRILLENVVGFELGTERERFIEALKKNEYHVKEFVGLSPETMLGVPVKRPRYYLLARRKELFGSFDIDGDDPPWMSSQNVTTAVEDIAQYLDKEVDIGLDVEEKKIKYWKFFDVVNVSSSSSKNNTDNVASTFTSGYGKTVFSGSFILKNGDIAKRDVNANNAYRLVKDDDNESDEDFAKRVSKSVRYFSPTELCRLHGIKDDFVFPPSLSMRQQYKLIGNGISVHVVAKLLEYLFK